MNSKEENNSQTFWISATKATLVRIIKFHKWREHTAPRHAKTENISNRLIPSRQRRDHDVECKATAHSDIHLHAQHLPHSQSLCAQISVTIRGKTHKFRKEVEYFEMDVLEKEE